MDIHGSWRLVSYDVQVQQTSEVFPAMGSNPQGYVCFSAHGRVWFMLTAGARQPGTTDAELADLLETVIAYTGRFRVEADEWITSVDVCWNPAWVGTEQRRQFEMEGDTLKVLTPWRIMPNWKEKGLTRSIIVFERELAQG